jgi:hypothetical protein
MDGERLLRDVAACFREGERAVWTGDLLERLKALNVGKWRTFKGVGLNEQTLGGLLAPLVGKAKQVKMGGVNRNGWKRADIVTVLDRIGGER